MSDLPERLFSSLEAGQRRVAERAFRRLSERRSGGTSRTPTIPWQTIGGTQELFDYQEELKEKAIRVLSSASGLRRGLIAIPTGGGKTRTAAVVVRELVASGQAGAVYWVAPGIELLWQANEAIRECWQRRDVGPLNVGGVVDDAVGMSDADVPTLFLVTPQWLASRSRTSLPSSLPRADLIVFDEAHHAVAPSFLEGIEALASHQRSGDLAPLLGLSATPGRLGDGGTRLLADFFERRLLFSGTLGRDPVPVLQERGVLSEVRFVLLGKDESGLRRVHDWDSRPNASELSRDPLRFRVVLDHAGSASNWNPSLVFASSIEHALVLVAALIASGVRTAAVTSETMSDDRERFLRWFRERRIPVLVNKDLLSTGFDLPSIRSVVLTVPVMSPIRFEQIVGRALRGPAVGGDAEATVFQFERHEDLHGELSSYSRFWDADWRPE